MTMTEYTEPLPLITRPPARTAPRPRPRTRARTTDRAWLMLPALLSCVLAGVYLLWQPPSVDLAAASYRAELFGRSGFTLWDLSWYSGHYLPGYSVLVPALSWLIGIPWLGAISLLTSVALWCALVGRRGAAAAVGASWFGLGVLASLLSGRITFTAAIPFALAALVLLRPSQRASAPRGERLRLAGALCLSALTAMASPVTALFLAVALAALLLTRRRVRYAALILATFAPIIALNVAFPETGIEPLSLSALLPVGIFTVVALPLLRRQRALAAGVVIYALACLVTWRLSSPVGANVLRFGPLCAGAVLAHVLWPRRRVLLLVLAVPLLAWQWSDAISDVRTADGDPSITAAYYAPLLHELHRLTGPAGANARGGFRVEIPFTRSHWEARWVAPSFPLARGWERQADIADNPLFYRDRATLTPGAYRAWLRSDAVRYVALPDTPLDYSALAERRLIERRPGYLRLVWHRAGWRLYAVRGWSPIVPAPLHLRGISTDAITLTAHGPATVTLRVRWTPYWDLTTGSGCVSRAGQDTRLRVTRPGPVVLSLRFAVSRIAASSPRCA